MIEMILIAIISTMIGYYGREIDLYFTNRYEQRLIVRIESLGWSALIGCDKTVSLYVVHATQPDNFTQSTHGVSRIVALSKMINELEKKYDTHSS